MKIIKSLDPVEQNCVVTPANSTFYISYVIPLCAFWSVPLWYQIALLSMYQLTVCSDIYNSSCTTYLFTSDEAAIKSNPFLSSFLSLGHRWAVSCLERDWSNSQSSYLQLMLHQRTLRSVFLKNIPVSNVGNTALRYWVLNVWIYSFPPLLVKQEARLWKNKEPLGDTVSRPGSNVPSWLGRENILLD